MMAVPTRYQWRRRTIAETYDRIVREPAFPWVAIGDFLDDWRRSAPADRQELVQDGPAAIGQTGDLLRWAAFCAATVEWLCRQDDLPFPAWTSREEYRLDHPWFLYPGHPLRAWQLATTPAPCEMCNIFGGDHMLDRV